MADENVKSLVVDLSGAKRTSYKPGESITYEGVKVMSGDEDVTTSCSFSPDSGSAYPAGEGKVEVRVLCEGYSDATFEIKRKRSLLVPILVLCAIVAICVGIYFATRPPEVEPFPEGDTGAYLIPQGDMSDEDAQKLVDEMAEKSRITVSLAPEMLLKSDGSIRVNLVVPEGNNGLSERLEVEQDGKVVYRSGVVEPGKRLEWGVDAKDAHAGDATATVYAIKDAADFGNPVSVEVKIVDSTE